MVLPNEPLEISGAQDYISSRKTVTAIVGRLYEGGFAMPTYEFLCNKCQKEFSVTMTIREREEKKPTCPTCGSSVLEPLMGGFFAKTSRKS
jgi:putative FmdB family regulatory protein